MKKYPVLAAAIAILAAQGAFAQTSITVQGAVDVFAGSLKNSGDTARRAVVNSGGMTTSYFGFKGSEDLGGGLKADFALNGFYQADTGTSGRFGGDNLFSRDANVGLSGSFGKIQFGRGLAPSFLPAVLFNPFGDSFTFSPLVVHTYVPSGAFGARSWIAANASDSGWSNEIIYSTPDLNGLRANLHYQFGEVAGRTGTNNIALNLLYSKGPLGLSAYYHDAEVSNPNAGGALIDPTAAPVNYRAITRQKAYFAGASYNFNVAKLFATYQVNDNDTATALSMKGKTFSLGMSAPLGQGSVLLGYANTKRDGSLIGSDIKRDTLSVGYDYLMSKRTDLYTVLMSDKITGASRAASFGIGVRHRF
ncbi:porin [Noviherbaspirillum saxi]|uniref:Porin n=1 Tax=Noviherbaspirillum saxi TaxID=2320863 RepID=A0A3A3FPD2_9BURK|nr:porin [Noviherbaspirillum saxi]RJF95312.1 porin [Noviherbaspirillum saxi]